jgi:hypothetical protein
MAKPELVEQAADELAWLVEQARGAEAPPLDGVKQYQMVGAALRVRPEPRRWAPRITRYAPHITRYAPHITRYAPHITRYALGLAAALLMGLLGARSFEYAATRLATKHIEVAPSGRPLRLWLRTGDALVLAKDSAVDVLSETPTRRKLRLTRGAVLCDVTRRAPGQSFEVLTPHARVQVRGTVFSVEVDAAHTAVQVHEGRVHVAGRVLQAGERWSSGGAVSAPDRALFASEVRSALARRQSSPAPSQPPTLVEPLYPSLPSSDSRAEPRASTPGVPTPSDTAESSEPRASKLPPAPESAGQPSPESALPTPEAAELLLRQGQAAHVLRLLGAHGDEPSYARVFADALRASGDFERAIAAYEALAVQSQGSPRSQAGFAAAQLALGPLHDPLRALGEVELFDLSAPSSVLRERASVLRIDALVALGRSAEARAAAREYLAREPETETSARLRGLVDAAARE